MSDAADTTFSVGETKLLISIMKNLEGDLQVCFHSLAIPLHRVSFLHSTISCAFRFCTFTCRSYSGSALHDFTRIPVLYLTILCPYRSLSCAFRVFS